VSRTPIREALRSLATRGLIDAVPGVGFIVYRYSLQQLAESYEARALLEGFAAEQAAIRAADDDKWRIEQEIRNADRMAATDGTAAALARSNLSFHELVAHAARNQYVKDAIVQLSVRPLAYRAYFWYDAHQRRARNEAHWTILEAIQRGDGSLARQRMVEHTEQVGQFLHEKLSAHPEFISEG
jgi:DNA-binding GntR family transcriptional regulator